MKDRHGTNGFVNLRSALWWLLREAFDPENDPEHHLAIPFIEELNEELSLPKWSRRSNGLIEIEDKASMKNRLGRSPDLAESLALAIYASRFMRRGWHIL